MKNMSRFMQVNAIHLRDRAAELQAQGIDLWTYYNFAPASAIAMGRFIPAKVFISEGSLNPITAQITTAGTNQFVGVLAAAENTYQSIMNTYGLRRGDQLTFVTIEYDAAIGWRPQWGRVIMDPRDSNGQPVALSSAFVGEDGGIVNPNGRNQGYFLDFRFLQGDGVAFSFLESIKVCAAGIIVSRKSDQNWLRSTCQLTMSEECLALYPQYYASLGAAADLQRSTLYFTDDHYLNNAGQSGAYSSDGSSDTPTPSGTLQLNSVIINGTTVDAAGGSTNFSGFPIETIKLQGVNLDNVPDGQRLGIATVDGPEDTSFDNNYQMTGIMLESTSAPIVIGIFNQSSLVRALFTINYDDPIENRP